MDKHVDSIAWLKGGIYQNLFVSGVAFCRSDIVVKKLDVSGVLTGKKIKCEDEMVVSGIVRGNIHFVEGNRLSMITGFATMQKQKNNHANFNIEGIIRADTIVADTFRLEGRCRIDRLEANTAELLESNSNYNHKKVIDEIVCKKLKAYNLNAQKVIAEEVELYGKCKIGTLIYKEKKCTSPDCVIENEKRML